MAWVKSARVAETSTSTGTGTIALAGALDVSYRRFSTLTVGDTFKYVIVGLTAGGVVDGSWERGIGTYSALNTLTRSIVQESTNANAAVSFASASLVVFLDVADRFADLSEGNLDVNLSRNAAGILEANNGTPGQFRDVKVRNLIAIGGANSLIAAGAATGSPVTITASGDTNLDINVVPAGTGVLKTKGNQVATLAGVETLTGKTMDGELYSISPAVTAGTNAQGQGVLTTDLNVITTNVSSPGGVTLPTAAAGRYIVVINKTANTLKVYPATGAQIDGLGANVAATLAPGSWMDFDAASTTQWLSGGVAGYPKGLGAGGTVTQLTSRTTGVTLNKATGQINLVSASVGSTGNSTFVLTNNCIEAGDVLVLNIVAGTFALYTLTAVCAAGSATIRLGNPSGVGSTTEVVSIAFALIKGSTT